MRKNRHERKKSQEKNQTGEAGALDQPTYDKSIESVGCRASSVKISIAKIALINQPRKPDDIPYILSLTLSKAHMRDTRRKPISAECPAWWRPEWFN